MERPKGSKRRKGRGQNRFGIGSGRFGSGNQELIDSLPLMVYSPERSTDQSCAVCLSEFDKDPLRGFVGTLQGWGLLQKSFRR